jgi:hypothetical protein
LPTGVRAALHDIALQLSTLSFTSVAKIGAHLTGSLRLRKSAAEQLNAEYAAVRTGVTKLDAISERWIALVRAFGCALLAQLKTVEDGLSMLIDLLLIGICHSVGLLSFGGSKCAYPHIS